MEPLSNVVAATEDGCMYGLIGLGYILILEATGFFNFALGAKAMFGGIVSAYLSYEHGLPLLPAVLAGIACAVTLSVLTDRFIVKPIESRSTGGDLPAIVAVTAVLFGIQQLAGTLFGREVIPVQDWVSWPPLGLGSTFIRWQIVLIVAVTLAIFTGVAVWTYRTTSGRLLRAVGDNREAASLLGLPVDRIRITAFAIAGAIVGLAGIMYSAKSGIRFDTGFSYSLNGFLALVVGGRGSIWAPLVGGLVLANVQILAAFKFGGGALAYSTLVIALVFFAFRPTGIISRRVRG